MLVFASESASSSVLVTAPPWPVSVAGVQYVRVGLIILSHYCAGMCCKMTTPPPPAICNVEVGWGRGRGGLLSVSKMP